MERIKNLLLHWTKRKILIVLAVLFVGVGFYSVAYYIFYGGTAGVQSHKASVNSRNRQNAKNNSIKNFLGTPSAEKIYIDFTSKYSGDMSYDKLKKMYGANEASLINAGYNWSPDLTPSQIASLKYNAEIYRMENGIDDGLHYLVGNSLAPVANIYVGVGKDASIDYSHNRISDYYGTNIYALKDPSSNNAYWDDQGDFTVTALLSPNGKEVLTFIQFTSDTPKDKANQDIQDFFKKKIKVGNATVKTTQTSLEALYKANGGSKAYQNGKNVMADSVYVFDAVIPQQKTNSDYKISGRPIAQFTDVKEMKF